MAKSESDRIEVDPEDGLPRSLVGEWSLKKHHLLCRYIDTCRATRKKWADRTPAFLDLYCGAGRSRIEQTGEVIDGGVLAAAKEAAKHTPFGKFVIADLDPDLVAACATRLAREGFSNVTSLVGSAESTVEEAVKHCDPQGLHIAYLDPFSIHVLPFSILRTIGATLKRADLFIHFSVMDYRRNLMQMQADGRLDAFAPGWEKAVTAPLGVDKLRQVVFEHWLSLIRGLGYQVSEHVVPVSGHKTAAFYWLLLASKHKIADKFWNAAADFQEQRQLL